MHAVRTLPARAVVRRFVPGLLSGLALAAGGAQAVIADPLPGDLDTLVAQAVAFEHGEGVTRDPDRAAELYCEASRAGSAEAMYSLGWMFANGRGVARNDDYAATLFEMAMAKGHAGAEQARRMAGEYTGAVPDCLLPRARDKGFAARDTWDTQKYLASLPEQKKKMVEPITTLAPRFSIEPRLALAIPTTESNFDPNAT